MADRRVVFEVDELPPSDWQLGATVPRDGCWWTISQQWFDEQTRRWHFDVDLAMRSS